MIFEEKKITLKNGMTAVLKTPELVDAGQMLDFIRTACGETPYLLRYPEECSNTTIESEETWINNLRSAPNTIAITCYVNGKVAGNCEIEFMSGMKVSHRATIAIALLQEYWNLGIGSAMFEEMIVAAKNRKTEIMELAFIEGNDRARHLYEKFGFRIVAERPKVIKLKDGTYLSEFYMQKNL